MHGNLTIKGHTRRVEARGTVAEVIDDPFGGTRVALELEAVIDRTDFGMDWNMPMPKGGPYLANEVRLELDLEFVKVG